MRFTASHAEREVCRIKERPNRAIQRSAIHALPRTVTPTVGAPVGCKHRERFPASLADANDGAMSKALPIKDVRLIIPNAIRSGPLTVTAMAGRHKVLTGVVVQLPVQMIDHKGTWSRLRILHPRNRSTAPVAGVRTGADLFVQGKPLCANAPTRRSQWMVRDSHVPIRLGVGNWRTASQCCRTRSRASLRLRNLRGVPHERSPANLTGQRDLPSRSPALAIPCHRSVLPYMDASIPRKEIR